MGSAVALATDVAGYATGINSAIGAFDDVSFNKKRELEKILKSDQTKDDPDESKEQNAGATTKKDGSNAKEEQKESTPKEDVEKGKEGRNQTVSEKQKANDANAENKPNANGTVYYKSCECGHTDKQSTFTVPYVEPLENTSAISASAITLGDTVTLTGSATGGTAPYQYQMLYKKVSDTKWTTKQNFSANTTVSIKPANATDYDVCIKVKDNTGTIEKKFFTVKVTNAKLTNNSTISVTEITLGNTITLTGSATGGTAPYTYAMFYKKKSDTKWTTKQDFKANASVSIKPANAVEYDVCIKVKDSTGTIEKKYFSVTVK